MLYSDKELAEIDLVKPFDFLTQEKVLSYGLSSYGYDVRLSSVEVFAIGRTNLDSLLLNPNDFIDDLFIDPKNFSASHPAVQKLDLKEDKSGKFFIVPPLSYILGVTEEYIKIPPNALCFTLNKSTYARSGINVPVTVLEPEWEGYLTLEIKNENQVPTKVYAEEGICQLVLMKGLPCKKSYESRKGKYQRQEKRVVFPKIK